MKNFTPLFITVISVFSFNCFAQKAIIPATDKKIVKYVYVDVIKTYERVAEKGYRSVDMFKKIGDSYYSNFELDKAARWYCELFAMTYDLEPKYYYQYAKSLNFIGQNDTAIEILEKLNQKSGKIVDKTSRKTTMK
jgi:tetratricopeptide (TPR) repeat protein